MEFNSVIYLIYLLTDFLFAVILVYIGVLQKSCIRTTTMAIIFLKFLMFYQIFLSPQVKGSLIISNKQVYASPPPKKKILLMLAKDSMKIGIEPFP